MTHHTGLKIEAEDLKITDLTDMHGCLHSWSRSFRLHQLLLHSLWLHSPHVAGE